MTRRGSSSCVLAKTSARSRAPAHPRPRGPNRKPRQLRPLLHAQRQRPPRTLRKSNRHRLPNRLPRRSPPRRLMSSLSSRRSQRQLHGHLRRFRRAKRLRASASMPQFSLRSQALRKTTGWSRLQKPAAGGLDAGGTFRHPCAEQSTRQGLEKDDGNTLLFITAARGRAMHEFLTDITGGYVRCKTGSRIILSSAMVVPPAMVKSRSGHVGRGRSMEVTWPATILIISPLEFAW